MTPPATHEQLVAALADVLEAFDEFADWIEEGPRAPNQGQLDRLNAARERGASLLECLHVYDSVN